MTKQILVIEDNRDNREILRDLLTSVGYAILEATTGHQGVYAAVTHCPDLILMDIHLPDIDGYEATRRIKAHPALGHIPIIAVTSYALSGDDVKAFRPSVMATSPNPSTHGRCWRPSARISRRCHPWLGQEIPDAYPALSARRG